MKKEQIADVIKTLSTKVSENFEKSLVYIDDKKLTSYLLIKVKISPSIMYSYRMGFEELLTFKGDIIDAVNYIYIAFTIEVRKLKIKYGLLIN